MLYDNAQLVTLYSEAFKQFKEPLYRDVVSQTLEFIARELTGSEGNIYSALDADSEGVEGKYYVWNREELQSILGNEFDFFAEVFNVNEKGFWEHNNYILLRDQDDDELATKFNLGKEEFHNRKSDLSTK